MFDVVRTENLIRVEVKVSPMLTECQASDAGRIADWMALGIHRIISSRWLNTVSISRSRPRARTTHREGPCKTA
jgi:hypothetical protein